MICACYTRCICIYLSIYLPPPPPPPPLSYDQYMSRLKPFWLSEVFCNTQTDSSLEECDRNLLIGYSSTCSNAFTDSVFNSAEIDCGEIETISIVYSSNCVCINLQVIPYLIV